MHATLHGLYCWACDVQVMQDRMAAVELMLLQKPIVSGQFTGHAFRDFMLPLEKGFRSLFERCCTPLLHICASVAACCVDSPSAFLPMMTDSLSAVRTCWMQNLYL